jgi:hypothetical protein
MGHHIGHRSRGVDSAVTVCFCPGRYPVRSISRDLALILDLIKHEFGQIAAMLESESDS